MGNALVSTKSAPIHNCLEGRTGCGPTGHDGSFSARHDTERPGPAPKTLPCGPPDECRPSAVLTPGLYYMGERGQVSQLVAISTREWSGGTYEVAIAHSGHWGDSSTSEQRSDAWASTHRLATDDEVAAALASWKSAAAYASQHIDTSREGT